MSGPAQQMNRQGGSIMSTLQTVFSKVIGGNQNELKKQCLNLNI